jgi:hypothetical protein
VASRGFVSNFLEEIAMRELIFASMAIVAGSLLSCAAVAVTGDTSKMSFFITSVGPGNGADLGGLEGADKHCQKLASSAGAGDRTWRAYLSTQGRDFKDENVVNARDRIGAGPWYNAKGVMIAKDVDELHSSKNNLNKETALDENGNIVNGRTEKPNKHDILTGSRIDGTSFGPSFFTDMTCGNWTQSGEGAAMVGHHDRTGPIDHAWAKSWNSAHISKGCGQKALQSTGGDGLLYCFAEK